jgi:hypothetical protein
MVVQELVVMRELQVLRILVVEVEQVLPHKPQGVVVLE